MELSEITAIKKGRYMVAKCPFCTYSEEVISHATSKRKEGREESDQLAAGMAKRRVFEHVKKQHPDMV